MTRGILCMTILAATIFGVVDNTLTKDWELVKDEDDVEVYLSSVQGSRYRARRDVTDIEADAATIEALQEDVKSSCKWIHTCVEMKLPE